jgi:D-alanyl-D-alanine carboxypeptidase
MKVLAMALALMLRAEGLWAAAPSNEAVVVCTRQLQAIGRALDAYQRDHGELPPHLSDLYPGYVDDLKVFDCPADASHSGARPDGAATDPGRPTSYVYEMSADPAPDGLARGLGTQRPRQGATRREVRMLDRVSFGDRAPVVRCMHHEQGSLNLTLTGQVYQSRRDWADEPGTMAAALERMESDLAAGGARFTRNWALPAVEEYFGHRIDAPLPPGLRYRLGTAAEQLTAGAEALPAASQGDAHRLAARFYRAAGQIRRAVAAAEAALRTGTVSATSRFRPDARAGAAFLLADLRYRAHGKRGAPPADAYLKEAITKSSAPGMSIAVLRDGQVILAQGYGLANVELSVPATKDTVYELASLTKQFTATAIMMLVEDGNLSLADKLSQFLPHAPAAWSNVTVRHLLTHTSGIQDFFSVPSLSSGSGFAWRSEYTIDEAIRLLFPLPLAFQPGEKWAYSNAGYDLLGMIIEKTTGKPYDQFLAERIFQPLHMTATRRMNRREIIPNRAAGYTWEQNALRNSEYTSSTWAYAEGGLASSVSDMAKWDAALYTERLLKRSSLEQMWLPTRLDDGTIANYGFGWNIGSDPLRKQIYHSGNKPGFSSIIRRYPDDRITVILLTNADQGVDTGGITFRVAAFYLPPPKAIEDRAPQTTRMLEIVLHQLAAGQADPMLFTPEAYTAITSEFKQARAFYQSLGRPRSFQLIEQTSDGKRRTNRYRMASGSATWIQTFVLTPDGKIADIRVAPE